MFKNKPITFEDIQKLNYNQFNTGYAPKDLFGEDHNPADDEILRKLRKKSKLDRSLNSIRRNSQDAQWSGEQNKSEKPKQA